jgi:adenine-specific DNA-methyltransferase
MRFIGNKENLLEKIFSEINSRDIKGETFFDFFSGTSSVAKFFKKCGYQIFSSDLLYFSYCLQYAYIKNNSEASFEKILSKNRDYSQDSLNNPMDIIINTLNKLPITSGFIYENYSQGGTSNLKHSRMYFSDNNAKKIDTIRQKIEEWKQQDLLTNSEYFILLSCLIESVSFFANISGVYGAFLKKWDPRALKTFSLRPIQLVINNKNNEVFNSNSIDLIEKVNVDILYLDPPYNERQYAPNYHILETIARYDNPSIKGITGMRNYTNQKSSFCNKTKGLQDLKHIVKNAKYKYLLLSYNSEGIMPQQEIFNILQEYGKTELVQFKHLRFKSNNKGESVSKKHINEQLYILEKKIK